MTCLNVFGVIDINDTPSQWSNNAQDRREAGGKADCRQDFGN